MADTTKITLSDKELSLVTNADWILTKHIIIGKVYSLFADNIPVIGSAMKQAGVVLPEEIGSSVPKIYKGENYLQLPYVMFDYPRFFDGPHIFALRTMFWWGNFFSITLHVSGRYSDLVRDKIIRNEKKLPGHFYIGIHEDQWQHHFEENNFLPVKDTSREECIKMLSQNDFIKIALKFNLREWNNMPALLEKGYYEIAEILA